MHNRKTMRLKPLKPADFVPVVRYANYHEVIPGQSWGPRTIADTELVLVVSGEFVYTDPAGEHAAGPGDVVFIPPGVVHILRHRGGRNPRFSCIHGEITNAGTWLRDGYRPDPIPQTVTRTGMEPGLHALFRSCAETLSRPTPYRDALLRLTYHQIWVRLAEYWSGTAGPGLSPRVRQMVEFLLEHLTEPVSRRDLARRFALTPEYVNAVFGREVGTSPTGFLHRERCLRAHHLMVDLGLSVKEAGDRVGFDDAAYFSRTFRKVMGIPPSAVCRPSGRAGGVAGGGGSAGSVPGRQNGSVR